MLDITERKLEEQRKDDFISIASHELKTPITTLKASLQLLDRIKEQPASEELPFLVGISSFTYSIAITAPITAAATTPAWASDSISAPKLLKDTEAR